MYISIALPRSLLPSRFSLTPLFLKSTQDRLEKQRKKATTSAEKLVSNKLKGYASGQGQRESEKRPTKRSNERPSAKSGGLADGRLEEPSLVRAKRRSRNKSEDRPTERSPTDEWNKAMTLLQYLD